MRGGGVRKRGKKRGGRKQHAAEEGWRKEEGKKSSWSETKKFLHEYKSLAAYIKAELSVCKGSCALTSVQILAFLFFAWIFVRRITLVPVLFLAAD